MKIGLAYQHAQAVANGVGCKRPDTLISFQRACGVVGTLGFGTEQYDRGIHTVRRDRAA